MSSGMVPQWGVWWQKVPAPKMPHLS